MTKLELAAREYASARGRRDAADLDVVAARQAVKDAQRRLSDAEAGYQAADTDLAGALDELRAAASAVEPKS